MTHSTLLSISPIDGRYSQQTQKLSDYFSEFALIKYRVFVEVDYFLALAKNGIFSLSATEIKKVKQIASAFSIQDAEHIKETEKITNHDVKAVEYFIKEKLKSIKLEKHAEWVHFGLTSQDINNTAIPMLWRDALHNELMPTLHEILKYLKELSLSYQSVSMLARTHGQAASPTRMGKEFRVFIERIENQLILFRQIPFAAKFGGATGNFNAHYAAFPKKNWIKFANEFVDKTLGLKRMQYTTQIEHYDMLAAQFDALKRINTILIDFSRDIWTYISLDYFKQKIKKNEVGSSAMPHKVNPIDFENAEGNLGMANASYEHLASKLPISRLQRDLTDSTVLRNIGMPMAHTLIALLSLKKGLNKLIINKEAIAKDLENNWAIVAEAIQTILRRERYPNAYEALKALTRVEGGITQKSIHAFIDTLDIDIKIKKELKKWTPHNYVGHNPD
ncbi:MAG: adenylosuccinate lyase [Chitinophagaceae bacterium]